MSNVALAIGGRTYTVACAEGEEDRLRALGRMIDDKLRDIGGTAHNEPRQLLFAALLLADDLHEARAGGAGPARRAEGAPADHGGGDAFAPQLEALADRLEKIAADLEH